MTAVLPTREENHPVSTPIGHQLDSHDLWRWVDRLTRDRREKLTRSVLGGKPWTEWVDVPALWSQLLEDLGSTSSGGGRNAAKAGSRMPINAEKLSLMLELSDFVAAQLRQHGHAPRIDTADGAVLRYDTPSDLRRLATVIVGGQDQHKVNWLTGRYRSFAARVETALTGEDESTNMRGARGHACPVCLTVWVTYERDGEQFRDPALVIALRDGQVQHITCRSCGTGWWRGDDVQMLTDQITANEDQFGDARVWGDTKPGRIGA